MMNRRTFLCGLTLETMCPPLAAEAHPGWSKRQDLRRKAHELTDAVINLKTAKALRLTIRSAAGWRGDHSMTDLDRLGFALVGFALTVVVGGVLLGLIGAWIKKA